jgi:hypothetical protein
MDFEIKDRYNKRNWHSGVVHACKPVWDRWSEVPEQKQDLYRPQHLFYKTICGVDSNWYTNDGYYQLTAKHEVTCLKCLKIMKEEIDGEKKKEITQQTYDIWKDKDPDSYFEYAGMYKRKLVEKSNY